MSELQKEWNKVFEDNFCDYLGDYITDEVVSKNLWLWIEQKLKEACKEQREICAEIIHTYVNDDRVEGIYQEILNAPEPKGEK